MKMTRRGFFGLVSAVIASTTLPLPALAAAPQVVRVSNEAGAFEFMVEEFDFGFALGVALRLPDGRMIAARALGVRQRTRAAVETELKQQLLARAERLLLTRKAA